MQKKCATHNKCDIGYVLRKNRVPMEDIDNKVLTEMVTDEDRLFMNQVICEEADLFYMDCYLRELFQKEKN